MTHNILLTMFQGGKINAYLPGMEFRRTCTVDAMGRKRREGWLQHCPLSYNQARCIHPPFVECYAIQAFSIASDFDPKLMPKIQNQITMRKVCIQSLLSLQLGSRETPLASHPETEEERCSRRNQRRTARAARVRCEPSTHRRDPRTGELARSSRSRAQPFLLNHCCDEHNQACLLGPLLSSSREGVTHSMQVARWVRTQSCSRSSILAPNSSGSESPPPSSRAAR